jgi:tyrosine-protein phosphatase SIW14
VSGWNLDQIVQEYQAFAEPKVRECDIKYITEYKISKLAGFFHEKSRSNSQSRSSVLTSSRMRNLLIASAAATVVWITTGILWGKGYL